MFNQKQDYKLIGLVKDNPMLYNPNDPKYMDHNAREVAWHKIGEELQRPATVCKLRWSDIRTVHRRTIKKYILQPELKIRWYKYDRELSFIKPFYRDIVAVNEVLQFKKHAEDDDDHTACNDDIINYQQSEDDETDNTDAESDENKPVKKSKRERATLSKRTSKNKKNLEMEEKYKLDPKDPIDAFLLAIGATMKTFSSYHLNKVKSNIFAVVHEHEMQQMNRPPYPLTDTN